MTIDRGSLVAAAALAAAYIFGGKFEAEFRSHRRGWLSAAGGVATAYVFVHLLPELYELQAVFTKATSGANLPFPERRVYISALVGFVVMYGLDHLVSQTRDARRINGENAQKGGTVYWCHLGGFAVFSSLVSYLMVNEGNLGPLYLTLYVCAMSFHFLAICHSLRVEHGALYDRSGKWVLAAGVLAGWAMGSVGFLPEAFVATLMGFVGGGVVINSLIMELPKEKEGRFWPFFAGAIGYGLIVLLLTRVSVPR
jgi:hypothetical protein